MLYGVMKNIFYLALLVLFYGCATSADTLSNSKAIRNGYVLGQSNKYTNDFGLWYTKYYVDPKIADGLSGAFDYLLIFRNPTEIASNERFILLKRETKKHHQFKIIYIKNDSSFEFYKTGSLNKYLKLTKKLGVPDSLKFVPCNR
jgi:hypothetical protein